MLTGTLVTAAGFLPIGMAKSSTGEYTRSLFQVVGIALLVSWIVAVLFTPYLGYKLLLPGAKKAARPDAGIGRARPTAGPRLLLRFRGVCSTLRAFRGFRKLVDVVAHGDRLFVAFFVASAAVPLRAAAVLPDSTAPRADGRPARRRASSFAHRAQAKRFEELLAKATRRHRELRRLRRHRLAALLPAARPAAAGAPTSRSSWCDQGHRDARERVRAG